MSQTTYLRVAIPVPLPKAFDYLPDQRFTAAAYPVGARVLVPFGRTQKLGVVLAHANSADVAIDKLKHVEPPIDSEALLDQTHLAFLRWAASYYHHPVGEVVTAALPLRLRKANAPLPLS
jgi:primosomal protein N' (replication factor Y)